MSGHAWFMSCRPVASTLHLPETATLHFTWNCMYMTDNLQVVHSVLSVCNPPQTMMNVHIHDYTPTILTQPLPIFSSPALIPRTRQAPSKRTGYQQIPQPHQHNPPLRLSQLPNKAQKYFLPQLRPLHTPLTITRHIPHIDQLPYHYHARPLPPYPQSNYSPFSSPPASPNYPYLHPKHQPPFPSTLPLTTPKSPPPP